MKGRVSLALLFGALIALGTGFGTPSPARREGYDAPDSKEFSAWLDADAERVRIYGEFLKFLADHQVVGIVPAWHLWRQGTDWRDVKTPPFAIPPEDTWAGMIPTLILVRDEVIPRVGNVEVVSGFRTEDFNHKAGGAPGSRHKWFEAVDVVPYAKWERPALHSVLLDWWAKNGEAEQLGLGLYDKIRFHVDAHKWRKW